MKCPTIPVTTDATATFELQHKRHQISPHQNSTLVPCLLSQSLKIWRIDFSIEMRADNRFRLRCRRELHNLVILKMARVYNSKINLSQEGYLVFVKIAGGRLIKSNSYEPIENCSPATSCTRMS